MVAEARRYTSARMDKRNLVVHDCLCPDGRRRTVRLNNGGEADTFYSIPATVSVSRKDIHRGTLHVAGYVTGCETEDGRKDYQFRAYSYRRNCFMFPEQFLTPGTTIWMKHGEEIYSHGIVCSWVWDERPYWMGPPRWLVVIDWTWHKPGAWSDGIDERDNAKQHDTQELLTGVYVGNYELRADGGGIGPALPWNIERDIAMGLRQVRAG